MEDHKKGYEIAEVKLHGYIDENGGISYGYDGEVSEIIGITLAILAGAALEGLTTEGLHKFADELRGLFYQAVVSLELHMEGGGVFGNDHFKN